MTTPTIDTGTTISVMPASEVPSVAVAARSTAAPADRCGVHDGRLTARGLFAQARLTCQAATAATAAQSTMAAHRPMITDPTAAMNQRIPRRTFGPAVDGRTRYPVSPSVPAAGFFGTALFFGTVLFFDGPLARDVVPRPGLLFRDFVGAAAGRWRRTTGSASTLNPPRPAGAQRVRRRISQVFQVPPGRRCTRHGSWPALR